MFIRSSMTAAQISVGTAALAVLLATALAPPAEAATTVTPTPAAPSLMASRLESDIHANTSTTRVSMTDVPHCPDVQISYARVSAIIRCDSGPGDKYAAYLQCTGNTYYDYGSFVAYSTDPNSGSGVGCTGGGTIVEYGVAYYTTNGNAATAREHHSLSRTAAPNH